MSENALALIDKRREHQRDAKPLSKSPDARVACVCVLDCSTSMEGPKIQQLNSALSEFKACVLKDRVAAANCEFAIVTFGGEVKVASDFGMVKDFNPEPLEALGDTPLG